MTSIQQQPATSHSDERLAPPACTVVVCTRNRPELLRRCLAEVRSQTFHSYEILVVDNNSEPTEAQDIAAESSAAYVLCRRPGLGAARNTGLHAARTEFVAFIDDDAVPDHCWLASLMSEFCDPQICAVTGRIHYGLAEQPSGTGKQYASRRVDRNTPDWFAMANFGGLGDGSNMAFRRNIIATWPGFDERLGRGALFVAGEEHFAFFELIDRGHAIVYTPEAIVHHPVQDAGGTMAALRPITISTAYITLLAVEHPRFGKALARFILDSIQRKPRDWGSRGEKVFANCPSRWRVYAAMLFGPALYLYVRLANLFSQRRRQSPNPVEGHALSSPRSHAETPLAASGALKKIGS